jgi:hypothetical protein
MANIPKVTLHFLTGSDIEVNSGTGGGVKDFAQPAGAAKKAPAKKKAAAAAEVESSPAE